MQQPPQEPPAGRPQFNVNLGALGPADRIILGGAGAFFIWSFIPVWYKFSVANASSSISAWHGITTFAAIIAVLALLWTGARLAGATTNVRLNFPMAYIDLTLAGLGLLFTLLGLFIRPSIIVLTSGLQWGYFVGLVLAVVWAYGAYMRYQEVGTSTTAGRQPPTAPPSAPPSGGGFTG
jgi:hypothetical protein